MVNKPRWGGDYYARLGFRSNPFTVHALRADEMGKRLLVGRDDEIDLVAQRLHKHGKITCLDGKVGVGKTSLVNVAAYEWVSWFNNQRLLESIGDIPPAEAEELVINFVYEAYH